MSRGTLDPARSRLLSYAGLSPSLAGFPKTILLALKSLFAVRNPSMHACWFRLPSISLAATLEIDVSFFSSGYLDVSVPRVSPPYVMDWRMDTYPLGMQVSPFRDLRI